MNQQLIDLIRGELAPGEAAELRDRLARDPALSRELTELEALFGLMRRGEEIEPSPGLRARVLRLAGPDAWQRLKALPGLVRYRFRHSLRFRVVTASLVAHLILMAVLYQVVVTRPVRSHEFPDIGVVEGPDVVVPDERFRLRLHLRGAPQGVRLRQYGAEGQAEAIERELRELTAAQRADGSFGSAEETAVATLALLAEGDSSTVPTTRGRAVTASMRRLFEASRRGEAHGALLAALVEDYVLSYEALGEFERAQYVREIRRQIRALGEDEFAGEALVLAEMAGFALPAGRDLGAAGRLRDGGVGELLDAEPSRLAVTVVLARGQESLDRERVRAWARPLFEDAIRRIEAGNGTALALLTLQAPYRL